jgi:poly(ADP-ribose) glycohydrolase ARH3
MMSARDARLGPALDKLLQGSETLHYSDDTEMMISVAESLIRTGGVSREDLLATLASNYDAARGYGHGMTAAVEAIRNGSRTDPFALWPEGSKGGGGAVRVVPIACAYHHDVDRLAALAEDATATTHAHPLGRAGGVAHATAIAHVIARTTDSIDAASLLAKVIHQRAVRGTALVPKLQAVHRLVNSTAGSDEAGRELGNGVTAEESVPLAMFAFHRWAPSFADVVKNTVLAGGDTDTAAAMSGALCGALVGEAGLPSTWLQRVEAGTGVLGHVRGLADSVFELWRSR